MRVSEQKEALGFLVLLPACLLPACLPVCVSLDELNENSRSRLSLIQRLSEPLRPRCAARQYATGILYTAVCNPVLLVQVMTVYDSV